MNHRKAFAVSSFAAAASLFAVASLPAQAAFYDGLTYGGIDGHVHFRATRDASWFNPANWSTGRVPGAGDTVVLDGNDHPVVDTTGYRGGVQVAVGDLNLRDDAVLETLPGTVLDVGTTVIEGRARLVQRSGAGIGDTLVIGGASTASGTGGTNNGGVFLNPTPQNKRTLVLQSSATLTLGLGGTTASSVVAQDGSLRVLNGRGHYATVTADTLVLEGDLQLALVYGFEPRPGDSFQILTANRSRVGEFLSLPEGGYVGCTDRSTCLRISYRGGDGNDVVLSAESVQPEIALLLPAVQKVREAAARSKAVEGIDDLSVGELPGASAGLLLPAVQKVREAAARSQGVEGLDDLSAGEPSGTAIGLLLPAVQKVREAAARSQGVEGLDDLSAGEPSGTAIGLLLPAVQKVREAAARSQGVEGLDDVSAGEPTGTAIGLLLPAVQKVRDAAAR